MNELKIFTNNELGCKFRTLVVNGEPWFIGKDVAEILGYTNSRKAIADHVEEDDKGVTKCDTLGGEQNLSVINESGLYSLIMGSKLDSAKQFKKWVTSEVLPSIRKDGAYVATTGEESDEDLIARALVAANRAIEKKNKIIEEQSKQIEIDKPKCLVYDRFFNSDDLYTTNDAAKILDLPFGNITLNEIFRKTGVQTKDNKPTSKYLQKQQFKVVVKEVELADNKIIRTTTTYITPKGLEGLSEKRERLIEIYGILKGNKK